MKNFTQEASEYADTILTSEGGVFCKGGLLSVGESFVLTWLAFSLVAVVAVFCTSGPLFYWYYCKVTFEKWQQKSNPKYPSVEKVRDEIIQMLKAVACAAICPALSVYLAVHGYSKAYCGKRPSVWYHVAEFVGIMVVSDFWEFFYHFCGHRYKILWDQHRHHHKFFNPSPFAVIADEFVDQFIRATPLLIFPLVVPINMDLMFFEFGLFFYGYGCYLHWGYELEWPDAHHPIFNTAFQHYCHHAKGCIGKPCHCGFFFKVWDNLFGSIYEGNCFCVKCERAQGKRTRKIFETIEIPNYLLLLQPSFWLKADVLTGSTSMDTNEVSGNVEQQQQHSDSKKLD